MHVHVINPLALSNNELYGSFDEGTHEWQDGVLARIMRTVCKDDSPDQKWILFDGPVDTLWIESMNTLLDDNKLLTLLSGERISMTPQVMTLQSAWPVALLKRCRFQRALLPRTACPCCQSASQCLCPSSSVAIHLLRGC